MIIESNRKASGSIEVKLQNIDGSSYLLDRKVGVVIDESLSWKYHISYTCSRISSNIGVISKLRHYLSIRQLKVIPQYCIAHPYCARFLRH